jgi:hypothetical protein
VNNKYVHGNSILNIGPKVSDSPVWSDMLKVREYYIQGRQVITRSGDKTRFWEDSWLFETPLAMSKPNLYDMCNDKNILVRDVIEKNAQLDFRRWLRDGDRRNWDKILEKLQVFEFQELSDGIRWKCGKKEFLVKTLYDNIASNNYGSNTNHI